MSDLKNINWHQLKIKPLTGIIEAFVKSNVFANNNISVFTCFKLYVFIFKLKKILTDARGIQWVFLH